MTAGTWPRTADIGRCPQALATDGQAVANDRPAVDTGRTALATDMRVVATDRRYMVVRGVYHGECGSQVRSQGWWPAHGETPAAHTHGHPTRRRSTMLHGRASCVHSSGGVPLFWQERKPAALWKRIFDDLSARSAVDLTPGGGLAARAAMEMGISYLGLARSAEQGQWLTAACDRAALIAAVTSGTAMFNHDLQSGEHLREADAAEDREGPDDDIV